ncbi:MAG TPA: hypothetical protein VJQ59_12270 [Candidatus Sulfotelmatobacter sp.]|nr:hypothetical protein [Candidatus Sulfotelmatobacter sp.]
MTEPTHRVAPETSSGPLKIPADQELLFREVLQLFELWKIPYAVAGAFAMQQHTGIFRDTKDLDLFLTAESATVALGLLQRAGFDCEICDPVWLFKAKRGEYFVDLITGMSNATIVVDDSWIRRARPAIVYDVRTCVLAAEELLASKLFVTRRERFDGADIAHIIYGTRGELDWARILQLAGDNWEMLLWALVLFRYVYPGQTSFVPLDLWRDLLQRFENLVSQPDPTAEFRGSLIDEKMFAIDLNEWGLNNLMQLYRERRMRSLSTICKNQ